MKNQRAKFFVIGLLGFFLIVWFVNSKDKSYQQMASLNLKYHLVNAEPLDSGSITPSLSSLLSTEVFKTSVIDSSQPQQDLFLKLNSDQNGDLKNIIVLKFQTDAEVEKIANDYAALSNVEYAEPNFELSLDSDYLKRSSSKKNIEKNTKDSSKVIIGLIDSGVDTSHPGLKGKFVDGWDFVENKKEITDENGHGTHLAGIMAKNSKSVSIMPLKITNGKSASLRNVVRAIKFATDNGAKIINLSLGLKKESRILKEAVSYASKRGLIIVAAAGNDNSSEKYYPAAWPSVFSVAAVDNNREKVFVSNFGEWVDYAASGQDVLSTEPRGKYAYRTGTSQSTSFLSAKVANIINELPKNLEGSLTDEIEKKLNDYSKPAKGKYAEEIGIIIE